MAVLFLKKYRYAPMRKGSNLTTMLFIKPQRNSQKTCTASLDFS